MAVNEGLTSLFSKGLDIFGNMVNGRIQEIYNENYMDKYGSVAAQWDMLRKKGINPYALAGNSMSNSGSSGTSASFGLGDSVAGSMANLSNSTLNPIVAQNVESQTNANNASARNNNSVAQYNEQTLQTRADILANQKQLSDLELGIKNEYAGRYSEILSLNIEQTREAINKTKEEISKITKEKDKIDKEIEEINQKIDNMKSEKELTEARTRLANLQSQSTYLDNRIKTVKADNMEQYGIEGGTAAEAAFIAGLNGDEETVNAYDDFQKKLREAESEGATTGQQTSMSENNPIQRQQNQLIQQRDKELADIDKQIEAAQKRYNSAAYSYTKNEARNEIESLKRQRIRIERRYRRRIRQASKGTSFGVSAFGFGGNVGT